MTLLGSALLVSLLWLMFRLKSLRPQKFTYTLSIRRIPSSRNTTNQGFSRCRQNLCDCSFPPAQTSATSDRSFFPSSVIREIGFVSLSCASRRVARFPAHFFVSDLFSPPFFFGVLGPLSLRMRCFGGVNSFVFSWVFVPRATQLADSLFGFLQSHLSPPIRKRTRLFPSSSLLLDLILKTDPAFTQIVRGDKIYSHSFTGSFVASAGYPSMVSSERARLSMQTSNLVNFFPSLSLRKM